MNKRKNLDKLLAAFKRCIQENDSDIKLVLAGRMNWGGEDVTRMVAELGLQERVHFTGYIEDEDLNTVIGLSLAMLYVSKYEGFGFPILEAMACGTAVICSNVSSIPEIAGDAALLIDPNSEESISEAMALLIARPELREELIMKGARQYPQFSWANTASKTLAYYQDILY